MSTPQTPTRLPSYIQAGETFEFKSALVTARTGDTVDPADAWVVTMSLLGKDSRSFTATAQPSESNWLFSYPAASTDTMDAGSYVVSIIGVLAGKTYVLRFPWETALDDRTIEVLQSPTVVAGDDRRTHNEIMLAKYQAELQARIGGAGGGNAAGSAHESWIDGDRSLQKLSMEDLESGINKYTLAVQVERNGGRLPPYAVYFTRPGF